MGEGLGVGGVCRVAHEDQREMKACCGGRSKRMYCMSWRRRSVGYELYESDNEVVIPSLLVSAVQFGEGTDVRLSTQTCGIWILKTVQAMLGPGLRGSGRKKWREPSECNVLWCTGLFQLIPYNPSSVHSLFLVCQTVLPWWRDAGSCWREEGFAFPCVGSH